MARKAQTETTATQGTRKRAARKRSTPKIASQGATQAKPSLAASSMQGFGDMSKMAKAMTPEQAIELYKANAALALEIINTAIEGTARLRKKQFEGEEEAREFQRRHARSAAEARDAVLEVLGSDRYKAMISELVAVVTTRLPAAGVDDDELRRRLRRQLRRRWRKLEQRMGRFEEDPESDLALHRARIAAKRCRAVAEAYAPVGGKRAVRFARSLPKLQDALGAEHDADVIRTWLRTATDVDAAFVAGELAATARADAARQQERWPRIWDRVQRRSRHL